MLPALLMPAFAEPHLDTSSLTVPYTQPLIVDRTTVVRGVEVAADGTPSAIVTATGGDGVNLVGYGTPGGAQAIWVR